MITDELRQRVQAHLNGPMSDDVYRRLFILDPGTPTAKFCSHRCYTDDKKAA